MVEREQILSFLKSKGPSVPNDIKRALGGDTMIFGAMLSELISRGSVFITKVKKGSSPFYYVSGQEKQLEKLIEFCNPKDQKTITLLKSKQILRDKSLELFERVSLRQVPDFAKELKVQTAQGEMLFWRYYLVGEAQAIDMLKKHYNKPKPAPAKETPAKVAKPVSAKPTSTPVEKDFISRVEDEMTKPKSAPKAPISKPTSHPTPQPKPLPVKKTPLPVEESSSPTHQQQLSTPIDFEKTEFYNLIVSYFATAGITVLSAEQIAKNREYEFVVTVPSAVGSMEMYVRARNKKKLNEGDVAPALLKAKTKDLPCIFLSNGEFTKKSLVLIDKEYKGLVIKQL